MAKGGRAKHAGKADKVVKSNATVPGNTMAKAALGAFLLGQVHGAKQAAARRGHRAPPPPPEQADPSAMGAPPPAPMGALGGAMAAGPPGGAMAGGAPGGMAKGGRVPKKDFKPGGNKGKLHRELNIPEGQKIPAARLASAKTSSNPEIRRDAIRAETMKHWKKG